jgi:hypothetical protein
MGLELVAPELPPALGGFVGVQMAIDQIEVVGQLDSIQNVLSIYGYSPSILEDQIREKGRPIAVGYELWDV